MSVRPASFDNLVRLMGRFPSLGPKSAARIALWLLRQPPEAAAALATAITDLRSNVRRCETCFIYAEGPECGICSDAQRDRATLCVVEDTVDAWRLESTGRFTGLYHVLGGALSPLDRIGVDELTIAALERRVKKAGSGFKEIILATDFDTEGNATAAYIADSLQGSGVRVTRLAYGLPVGGELEYSDDATLTHALSGRREV